MKLSITIIISLILTGCASTMPTAGISQSYKHVGAKVISPSEPNWYLMKHTDPSVVFAKEYPNKNETAIANTYLIWIGKFESDESFFEAIKKGREANDDKSRFKQIKLNYEPLTYKDRPCIKFSGVAEDHGQTGINSKEFQYFKNFGYICRTNLNQTTVLLMEVSHRSNSQEIPLELSKTANDFFNNIELTAR